MATILALAALAGHALGHDLVTKPVTLRSCED